SAQATYQSDVTEVPIPNSSVEPLNKDQYKATITANQLIYGGGVVPASVKVREAEAKAMQQQVEVSLYQLKKQVNQLYFSILLLQEKQKLLIAKKEQLDAKLKEVKSGVQYGVLLPASDKVLEAELLKINQQFIEIEQNKLSLLKTLSSLTGKEIANQTVLTDTEISMDVSDSLKRPELSLFNYKKEQLEASKELIAKENIPKLMGFATGGYGNPGLNMLDNSFQAFYIVGLKLNWNVFDWNATKRKRESLQVNSDIIDNEESVFQLNTSIELDQQLSEIQKLISIIDADEEIVKLREEVLNSANSQLQNGVITSSQYITELTNLYESQNELSTHKIQLKLAKATYNTIKGQ
ncbi:MAG: TolC family protein, partial [Flavobacteriaceae bacterium]|nr:TolC family protein [Flavobacteriaceae bacterium]